jgi:hypothetical protein
VRNDFLDCLIELRKATKDEAQGDVQSAKNANTGETFSKFHQLFIYGVTGYKFTFSEKCYIYNIINLVATNSESKSVSLDALEKRMMAQDYLHITFALKVSCHFASCELLHANKLKGNISVNSFRETNHIKFHF